MTFLEKLDFEMASRGMKRPDLARLSGVPYTTIDGFYKKGYENAKISTIRKIAKALGVSLDWLIEDTDQDAKDSMSPKAVEIARAYDKADEDRREIVDAALRPWLESGGKKEKMA